MVIPRWSGSALFKVQPSWPSRPPRIEYKTTVVYCRLRAKSCISPMEVQNEFIKMLSEIKSIWSGQQGHITIVKLWVKVISADAKPIYSRPNDAWLNAQEFCVQKVNKVVDKRAPDSVQTKRRAPFGLPQKKTAFSDFALPITPYRQ